MDLTMSKLKHCMTLLLVLKLTVDCIRESKKFTPYYTVLHSSHGFNVLLNFSIVLLYFGFYLDGSPKCGITHETKFYRESECKSVAHMDSAYLFLSICNGSLFTSNCLYNWQHNYIFWTQQLQLIIIAFNHQSTVL